MKCSFILGLALMLTIGISSSTFAGYTVLTGNNAVKNTDIGAPGGSVGDSFSVGGSVLTADSQPAGTFIAYTPDTPADPQISGADLNFYRYNLTGTISSIMGNLATYTGSYLIFYDLDLNGEPNENLRVSAGTLNAT